MNINILRVYVPKAEDAKALKEIARTEGKSISEWCWDILQKAIQERRENIVVPVSFSRPEYDLLAGRAQKHGRAPEDQVKAEMVASASRR